MTKSISLTKTLALAMVSHLAITTASFGMDNEILTDAMNAATTTKTVEQVKDSGIRDIENQLPPQQLSATEILNKKGEEASTAFKALDTTIK